MFDWLRRPLRPWIYSTAVRFKYGSHGLREIHQL